jgi:hypothetical protein
MPLSMDEALSHLITARDLAKLTRREVLTAAEALTGARLARATQGAGLLADAQAFLTRLAFVVTGDLRADAAEAALIDYEAGLQ